MSQWTFSYGGELYHACWGLDAHRRFAGFTEVDAEEAVEIMKSVLAMRRATTMSLDARPPSAWETSGTLSVRDAEFFDLRLHRIRRRGGLPLAPPAAELVLSDEPDVVPTTWIEILVSSAEARAYPHAKLDVQVSGGGRSIRAGGVWRDESVPLDGQCTVRAVLEFGALADPHPHADKVDHEHRLSPKLGDTIVVEGLATTARHHLLIDRPRLWRPETYLFPTRPGSALALPGPWTSGEHPWQGILAVLHKVRDEPGAELVIVAHPGAEPEETAEGLIAARAEGYLALLKNDEEVWVSIATEFGSLRDIVVYLDHLSRLCGWSCAVDLEVSEREDEVQSAISAFQKEFNTRFDENILVDGICGRQTLGAVFRVLQDELAHWLEKHGLPRSLLDSLLVEALDASGFELPRQGLLEAPARGAPGIDLLVLERDARAGKELTPELLYASPIPLLERLPVADEPAGWKFGTVTLVVDQPPGEVRFMEGFRLHSDDGSYDQTRTIPDDAIDDGLSVVRFEDVPVAASYTLELQQGEGAWEVLIEGASYADLHAMTQPTSP